MMPGTDSKGDHLRALMRGNLTAHPNRTLYTIAVSLQGQSRNIATLSRKTEYGR